MGRARAAYMVAAHRPTPCHSILRVTNHKTTLLPTISAYLEVPVKLLLPAPRLLGAQRLLRACEVRLELRFEPKSRLLGIATTLAFQRLADRLVGDFSAAAMAAPR